MSQGSKTLTHGGKFQVLITTKRREIDMSLLLDSNTKLYVESNYIGWSCQIEFKVS